MNSVVATFILVVVTVGLALGVLTYVSANSSSFYANSNSVKQAQAYSEQIQISSSQPAVKVIAPNSPGIPLNYSVSYVVTFNIPGYSGYLILFPFITSSNTNLATYDPFSVRQVSNPNYVGYIKITSYAQITPLYFNKQIIYASSNFQLQVSGIAYKVVNGQPLNITYVTNSSSLSLVIWVIVNISGHLYRIAYPTFSLPQGIITDQGLANFIPVQLEYYQYLQHLFGDYTQIYYLSSSATIGGNVKIISENGNIGMFSSKPVTVTFNGNAYTIKAQYVAHSPQVQFTGNPPSNSIVVNNYPNVSLSTVISPLLTYIQKNTQTIYFTQSVTFGSQTFNYPVVFEGPVYFKGGADVTFNAPVIFEGKVYFQGNSQVTFNAPVVFEGTISFEGGNANIIAKQSMIIAEPISVSHGTPVLTIYGYLIDYGGFITSGNPTTLTLQVTSQPTTPTVSSPPLYTSAGNAEYFSAWFKIIPNNATLLVLNYTIYNLTLKDYIVGYVTPINQQQSQLSLYLISSSGNKIILSTTVFSYGWYYINITLVLPNQIIAALYSTSTLLAQNSVQTILPTNSSVSFLISNEAFSQVLFASSEEYPPLPPPSIYGNGQGYLVNYTSYLSQQINSLKSLISVQGQAGEVILYYYLVSNNPGAGYYIPPTYAYPSTYYNYVIQSNQSIGVSP